MEGSWTISFTKSSTKYVKFIVYHCWGMTVSFLWQEHLRLLLKKVYVRASRFFLKGWCSNTCSFSFNSLIIWGRIWWNWIHDLISDLWWTRVFFNCANMISAYWFTYIQKFWLFLFLVVFTFFIWCWTRFLSPEQNPTALLESWKIFNFLGLLLLMIIDLFWSVCRYHHQRRGRSCRFFLLRLRYRNFFDYLISYNFIILRTIRCSRFNTCS